MQKTPLIQALRTSAMINHYEAHLPNGKWTSVFAQSKEGARQNAADIFLRAHRMGVLQGQPWFRIRDFKNIKISLVEGVDPAEED